MRRALPIVSALFAVLGTTACGSPGRQAAWEVERPANNGAVPVTSTVTLASLASRAEDAWAARDSKDETSKAIETWEEVLEGDANNAELLVRLSRAYYFIADAYVSFDEGDRDEEEIALYEKGAAYSERALMVIDPAFESAMRDGGDFKELIARVDERSVPAAYWLCLNLARFAAKKGLSTRIHHAEGLRIAMERVLALRPDYFFAGPDRFLGGHYAAVPSVAGKDLAKSALHFQAARARSPEFLGTAVAEAQFLAFEKEDRALYQTLLEGVLAAPDAESTELAPENRAAKRTAKKLLQTIGERF